MPETLFERMDDRAHARSTDPGTSHAAADAATLGIERQRRLVLEFAHQRGSQGFVDAELEERHPDESPSGLRTRRSELVERNLVLDSGMRRRWGDSPNQRIVWRHRDYHPGAPPVRDPTPKVGNAEKEKGRAAARQLDEFAVAMRKEGRGMFADALAEAAELMRCLSR